MAAAGSALAADADSEAWIRVAASAPYVMPADRPGPVQLPFRVTLDAQTSAKDVTIQLLDARYDKLVDARVLQAFKVQPSVVPADERGPSIRIDIDRIEELRPGAYQLTLAARKVQQTKPVLLNLAIDRPAVQFEAPGKVLLDVRLPFDFWRNRVLPVVPPATRLEPTADSTFARLDKLEARAGALRDGGEVSEGSLEVRPQMPVPAGSPLPIHWSASGVGAGTWGTKVDLSASQFKAPRTLEVELQVRHHRAWVWVLVVVGILAGWIVRVRLRGHVDLSQSRETGASVAVALERRLARVPDRAFHDKVGPVLKDLIEALDGGERAAIDGKVDSAKKALDAAEDVLKKDVDAVHARCETWLERVIEPSPLPAPMRNQLEHASRELAVAKRLLEGLDPGAAKEAIDALDRQIVPAAVQALALWHAGLPRGVAQLVQLGFALEAGARADLEKGVQVLGEQISAVKPPGNLDGIVPTSQAIRNADARIGALLQGLADQALPYQYDRFESDCKKYGKAADAALAEGRLALNELCQQLRAARLSAEPTSMPFSAAILQALEGGYQRVCALIRAALAGQLTPEQLQAFDRAISERRYADAVAQLPAPSTILSKAPTEAVYAAPRLTTDAEPAELTLAPASGLPRSQALSLDSLLARARQDKRRGETLQTLVSGALIAGIGYALFADKFVGTLSDVTTVLLWGFSLDVSVAKLSELASPWVSKVKPA